MSVYTQVSFDTLASFIGQFSLGNLQNYTGIAAGIENTNYMVQTTQGEYVLTLFEHNSSSEVEQFIALALHLGEHSQLPVPAPIKDQQGTWLHQLEDKPAVLCKRFPGEHITDIQTDHCRLIGVKLAELHLAASNLTEERPNPRGFEWWQQMASQLQGQLPDEDLELLHSEVAFQASSRKAYQALPGGWIHGDLFHDNALFVAGDTGSDIGAILDLYNACQDAWLFDLAIVANDWCYPPQSISASAGLIDALLAGYQSTRTLTDSEQQLWPTVRRAAALRFWLSRILTQQHQASQQTNIKSNQFICKDPNEYRDKLIELLG